MPRQRLIFLFLALSFNVDHALSRSLGDNCKRTLSQRGECGDLACSAVDVPYVQCARARTTGEGCLAHEDCARDHFCGNGSSCRPSRKPGVQCTKTAFCDKSRGLTCSSSNASGTCVDRYKKGVPCTANDNCEDDAYCDQGCTARQGGGKRCKSDEACDDGLWCSSDLCVTHPVEGESCKFERLKLKDSTFRPSSNCVGNLDCVNTVCVARSGSGGEAPDQAGETDGGPKSASTPDDKLPGKSEENGVGSKLTSSPDGEAPGKPEVTGDRPKPTSSPDGEAPGKPEVTGDRPKPTSGPDGEAPGKPEVIGNTGLNMETKVGLAVGVPSLVLSFVTIVIGCKQLKLPQRSGGGEWWSQQGQHYPDQT